MSRRVSFVGYVERNGDEIAVDVSAVVSFGSPGTLIDPPDPGEIADLAAEVDGKPFELTDAEREKFGLQAWEWARDDAASDFREEE